MTIDGYHNPNALASRNPALFYPDDVFDGYVSPLLGLSWKPEGSAFRPPSDYRQTVTGERLGKPQARRMGRRGAAFRPNYPNLPDTQFMPPLAVHDATMAGDTSDPRTVRATQVPAELNTAPVAGSWHDRILSEWATSPIGLIFLGLAGVVLFNEIFLRQRGVSRGATRTGAAVAGVGTAATTGATNTGKAGIDAVNEAVGGAVEAIEDVSN